MPITYSDWIEPPTYTRDHCPPGVDPVTGEDDPLVAPADQVGGAWLTNCATDREKTETGYTEADKLMPRLVYEAGDRPYIVLNELGQQVENYTDYTTYWPAQTVEEAAVLAKDQWEGQMNRYANAGAMLHLEVDGTFDDALIGIPVDGAPRYMTRKALIERWATENFFNLGGRFGYVARHPHNVADCDYDAIFADGRYYTTFRSDHFPSDSRRKYRFEARYGLSDWPQLVSRWNTRGWTPWELPDDQVPDDAVGFQWEDPWPINGPRVGIVEACYWKQMIDLSKRMRPGPEFGYVTGIVAFSPRADIILRSDSLNLEQILPASGIPETFDVPEQWVGPRYDTTYHDGAPTVTVATYPGASGEIRDYMHRMDVVETLKSWDACLIYVRPNPGADEYPDDGPPMTPRGARWSTGTVFHLKWELRIEPRFRWIFGTEDVRPDPVLTVEPGPQRRFFWN